MFFALDALSFFTDAFINSWVVSVCYVLNTMEAEWWLVDCSLPSFKHSSRDGAVSWLSGEEKCREDNMAANEAFGCRSG